MAEVYRTAAKHVAYMSGVQSAVRDAGSQVAARARSKLAGHRDTGAARIRVEARRPDYLVHLDDEAAAAIEFGGQRRDGTAIQGLFILTDSAP